MDTVPVKGGMGGGLVPGTYPPPTTFRPDLTGERYGVVAGHPLVAAVAHEVFAAGGNAVDAGVAAGLASNVVQVDMANFGGIAPILIRPAGDSQCWSIAGVGRWSKTVTLEAMLDRYDGSLPLDGAPAIVPGAPAAWLAALGRFGTMSVAEVAAPAIELASKGFLLDPGLALSLDISSRGFGQWPSSVAVYRPGGKALQAGERLRQPALADTLRRLVQAESSASGSRPDRIRAAHNAFYRGEVASMIAQWVVEHGGFMTEEDLGGFEADIAEAPSLTARGWHFHATDSWSQGPVALAILGLISRTGGTWHDIAEAITLAFNDREDFLAEPAEMARPVSDLLSPSHLSALASLIGDEALPGRPGSDLPPGLLRSSTTAVVTMDAAGNTFATAPSDTLDGGPIIPELGIMCSPRGVQSRLRADHPNRLRPGGRPTVTPAALIGLQGDDVWALACPGGDVIVQAMAQVAWRVLDQGMSLQEAVEAPRIAAFNAPSAFHPHPSADRLVFVEGRILESERQKLIAHGHQVELWPDFEFDAGSVQTLRGNHNLDGDRVISAGADPRRLAYAIVR